MRSNFRSFKTTAPVNTNVDDHTTWAHIADHFFGHIPPGFFRSVEPKAPTATSQVFNCLASILGSITEVHKSMTDIILQSFKPVNAIVKNFYRSAEGKCCPGCIFSHYSCADDNNFCWWNT